MKKSMRTVNEAEVKENLDALLDEVAHGAQIAITRRPRKSRASCRSKGRGSPTKSSFSVRPSSGRGSLSMDRGRKTSAARIEIADASMTP